MSFQSSKKILGLTRTSSSVSPFLTTPKKPPDPIWVKHLNHLSAPSAALIRLRARIHSRPANVLVDSGANGNFISQAYVDQHNIPTQAMTNPQRVLLADGHPISADRLVLRSPFSVAHYNSYIDFAVLPINGYDAILGMPWLKEVNPVIDWTSQCVTIGSTRIHTGGQNSELMVIGAGTGCSSSYSDIHRSSETAGTSIVPNPNTSQREITTVTGLRQSAVTDSQISAAVARPVNTVPVVNIEVPTCSESSSACSRTICSSNRAYCHRNSFQPLENIEKQCGSVHFAPVAARPEPSSGAAVVVESSSESCSACSRTREQSFPVSNRDIPVEIARNTLKNGQKHVFLPFSAGKPVSNLAESSELGQTLKATPSRVLPQRNKAEKNH